MWPLGFSVDQSPKIIWGKFFTQNSYIPSGPQAQS